MFCFADGGESVPSKKHSGLMKRFKRAALSSRSTLSCGDAAAAQCDLVFSPERSTMRRSVGRRIDPAHLEAGDRPSAGMIHDRLN